MKKNVLGTLIAIWSVASMAESKIFPLNPDFHGSDKVEFSSFEGTLKGSFVGPDGQHYNIPDVCEPEGGSPEVSDVYSVKGRDNDFVFGCAWVVQHSGVGLNGSQYEMFVYSGKDLLSVEKSKVLSRALSGYEGSLEGGDRSYSWYSTRRLATEKLLELEAGVLKDSLALAHEIVLVRLKDGDLEAIKSYFNVERVQQLLGVTPVAKSSVVAYNDIGYALGQAGEANLAYQVLKKVERVSPERVVLKLNIADVLWGTDREKSKAYYVEYIKLMKRSGKEKLIPKLALERSVSN